MEIPPLYEEFLSYLDLERAYSPLTITACRSDARLFLRYLQEARHQPSLDAIGRNAVRGYIAWLSREGLAQQHRTPSTLAALVLDVHPRQRLH